MRVADARAEAKAVRRPRAGLGPVWSGGAVEGDVNRLKTIESGDADGEQGDVVLGGGKA